MMGAKTYTVITNGLQSILTPVRVSIDRGLPSFRIIGAKPSIEKIIKTIIISQFKQNKIKLPPSKIRIEIEHTKIIKISVEQTFPIFMAILRHIQHSNDIALYYGVISLDGKIYSKTGWYQAIYKAQSFKNYTQLVVPTPKRFNNKYNPNQYNSVKDVLERRPSNILNSNLSINKLPKFKLFNEIIGQEESKRVALISIAGGHSIYLKGSMGSGKSEIALSIQKALKHIKYIHPNLENEYFSAFGPSYFNKIIDPSTTKAEAFKKRPSILQTNHRAIYIDELPEIRKNVAQPIKQILDTNQFQNTPIYITFVFTGNLCICGKTGLDNKTCTCTKSQQISYCRRISQPFLNRIQLHTIISNSLTNTNKSLNKPLYRSALLYKVWNIQKKRYHNKTWKLNAHIPFKEFNKYILINNNLKGFLISSLKKLRLNRRDYTIVLKVARTIADLEQTKEIQEKHILEAISYRPKVENM